MVFQILALLDNSQILRLAAFILIIYWLTHSFFTENTLNLKALFTVCVLFNTAATTTICDLFNHFMTCQLRQVRTTANAYAVVHLIAKKNRIHCSSKLYVCRFIIGISNAVIPSI